MSEEVIDMSGFATELQEALSAAEKKETELMKPQEKVEEKEEIQVETETEEVEEVSEDKEEVKDDEEFPLIPKEWTAEEKAEFEDIIANPELKKSAELMINRYDNLKKGFYKKADELAQTKKNLSEFNEIFDPYKDTLKQRGHTPATYINSLLNVDRQLSQDPASVIKKLMEAYKVTPENLGMSNEADDYYEDEKYSKLERKIKELEGRGSKDKEDAERIQRESDARAIRDFKYAIDDNGESKYPLFDEVQSEMGILLNNGKATTLEEAYFKSPTVREKLLEEKQKEDKSKELEVARKKATQAKKASKGVRNNSSADYVGKDTRDLSAMLAESFRNAGF